MPELVRLYVGDVLWGALFYLLIGCIGSRLSDARVAVLAVTTTVAIEVSQLYRAEWMQALRATRLGGLALGHQFLWSDVVCVTLGVLLAAVLGAVNREFSRSSDKIAGATSLAALKSASAGLGRETTCRTTNN
jgi:Protein of unknown function (DUF2809)